MTSLRRVTLSLILTGLVGGLTGGCIVNNSSDGDCEARTLDLREPPSRDDLGMPAGESVSTLECDDGFGLRIVFPEDRSVELVARALGADSMRAADQESGNPTTIDVHSTWLSIDDAADLALRIADTLGMDPSEIETWRGEASQPPDPTVDTKTGFIRASVGYVDAEMQVIHQSVEDDGEDNTVHLILYPRP